MRARRQEGVGQRWPHREERTQLRSWLAGYARSARKTCPACL